MWTLCVISHYYAIRGWDTFETYIQESNTYVRTGGGGAVGKGVCPTSGRLGAWIQAATDLRR